jgi:hypothetical protein
VWIVVAVPAKLVRDGTGEIGILVTFPAGHLGMLSGQQKTHGAVINIPDSVIPTEAVCVMASFAPRSGF